MIFPNPSAHAVLSSRAFAAALIFPLVLVAGCSAGEGPTDSPADAAPALELIAKIGCVDCGDERQVTPTIVTLFGDGRVAVLDRYEPFVRIFAVDGSLLLAYGTMGQGPGELGTQAEEFFPGMFLVVDDGGGISVVESMPVVLEAFDAGGNFIEQRDLQLPVAVPYSHAYSPRTREYFRYEAAPLGEEPGEIKRCHLDEPASEAPCGDFIAARTLLLPRPDDAPRPSVSIATTPEGLLVVADEGTYRLWVIDEVGSVTMQTGRDVARWPKNEEELERDREIHQRVSRLRDEPIDPLRGHIVHAGLQVDGNGRIWVLTERYGANVSVFDIFAPDGAYLAEITVPTAIRASRVGVTPIMSMVDDRLAAITQQPDGSEQVWVWQIVDGQR